MAPSVMQYRQVRTVSHPQPPARLRACARLAGPRPKRMPMGLTRHAGHLTGRGQHHGSPTPGHAVLRRCGLWHSGVPRGRPGAVCHLRCDGVRRGHVPRKAGGAGRRRVLVQLWGSWRGSGRQREPVVLRRTAATDQHVRQPRIQRRHHRRCRAHIHAGADAALLRERQQGRQGRTRRPPDTERRYQARQRAVRLRPRKRRAHSHTIACSW